MSEGDNETLYIIVGAAAGGGVAALVALTFLALRRRHLSSSQGSVAAVPKPTPEKGEAKTLVSSEIMFREDELEVSTLGDPVFGGGGMNMNGGETHPDEQTASVGNDYDYHKQYLKSQGIVSLDSEGRMSSDVSLEIQYGSERFEIRVPPGKLGMVIDTPNGGVPMVHAIKADSALSSQVKVGDRLIFVDGDDVTFMTAMQVSRLIALKADQQRDMVFLRGYDVEIGGDSIVT
jgi:hypothetical protein